MLADEKLLGHSLVRHAHAHKAHHLSLSFCEPSQLCHADGTRGNEVLLLLFCKDREDQIEYARDKTYLLLELDLVMKVHATDDRGDRALLLDLDATRPFIRRIVRGEKKIAGLLFM